MKWKNWLSIACILGTLANPFKGNAQSFNGTLEGKIVDLSGTPINDTRIHVVDNSNPANFWDSVSDSEGNYKIKIGDTNPVDNKDQPTIPKEFKLFQNYPNPFNPMTNIRFYIPGYEQVKIDIYTPTGSHVKTLTDKQMLPGYNQITWDGRDKNGNMSASSVYFYRIQAGAFQDVKKMLLMHNSGRFQQPTVSQGLSKSSNAAILSNLDVKLFFSSYDAYSDSVESLILQEGPNYHDMELNRKPIARNGEEWLTYDNFFPNDSIWIDLSELIIDDDYSKLAIRQKNIGGDPNANKVRGAFDFSKKAGSDSVWIGAMVKSILGEFDIGMGIYDNNHIGSEHGELKYFAKFILPTQGFEKIDVDIFDYRHLSLANDTLYIILEGPNHTFFHRTEKGNGTVWALNSATAGGTYQVYVDDELEKYEHTPLIGDPQVDFEQFKKLGNWIRYYVGEVSLPTNEGPFLAEPMHETMNWNATNLAEFFTEIDFPAYAWLMSLWRLGLPIDPDNPDSPDRLNLYRYGDVETGVPEFDELEPYWNVNVVENKLIDVALSMQNAEANVAKFSNEPNNNTAAQTYREWVGDFFRKSCPSCFLISENDLPLNDPGIDITYDSNSLFAVPNNIVMDPTNPDNFLKIDLPFYKNLFKDQDYPPSTNLRQKFIENNWLALPAVLGFKAQYLSSMPGMHYGGVYNAAKRIFLKPFVEDGTNSIHYDPRDVNILKYFFSVTHRSKNPLSHRFD